MSRSGKIPKKKKQKLKRQNKKQNGGGFVFQNYIVCLIDILGQSEQLKSWPPLPVNEQEMAQFEAAVAKSLGVVELLTIGFRKSFDLFLDPNVPNKIPVPLGVDATDVMEYRRMAVKARENKIGVQQFSDTLVFYVPIFQKSLSIPTLMPIIAMVHVCSSILIESLSREVAFRGGISIGVGTYTNCCGFYGPVLQEAHHLESKVAQYPRIVLGKKLQAFLHERNKNILLPKEIRFFSSEETILDGWIFEDDDGWQCLDFIGKGMQESISKCDSDFKRKAIEKIHKAYSFVCKEEERFKEIEKEKEDKKLYKRYKRLREYMDSRLVYWRS